MDLERKQNTKIFAQELRKNATKEENHLWYDFLKTHPLQFRRQKPFGQYIVDFYCDKAKLAIELDGSQHYEEVGLEYDKKRAEYLSEVEKIQILRFSNLEIQTNFEGVCAAVDAELEKRLPSSVTAAPCHLPPRGKAERGEAKRSFAQNSFAYFSFQEK